MKNIDYSETENCIVIMTVHTCNPSNEFQADTKKKEDLLMGRPSLHGL